MNAANGARRRSVLWDDPRPALEAAARMSGLEYLRALADGSLPMPPIMPLIGAGVSALEEGRAVMHLDPAEYHYNALGTVHGGVVAMLCDTAMGCAVQSTLPVGVAYSTLELKVNYVRSLRADTGRVFCEAKMIYAGRRTATAEARLLDGEGRLYAHAIATCILLGHRAPVAPAG